MGEEIFIVPVTLGILFIGLPWLIFHYVTQWKRTATLSSADEKLLDELHETARRLDDRLRSIERIIAADGGALRPSVQPTPTSPTDYPSRH